VTAKESRKQLVIIGRSSKNIEKIAKLPGYFSEIPAFLEGKKAASLDSSNALFVCTGSQGELHSALSKMASGTHKFVRLTSDDIIVFSSRVIPGTRNLL
jgi:ribonuclease J